MQVPINKAQDIASHHLPAEHTNDVGTVSMLAL